MESRVYTTIVTEHELFNGEYVLGRISGMLTSFCKEDPASKSGYSQIGYLEDGELVGRILRVNTTEEKYDVFRKCVEELYPGVCRFDVKA